LAPREVRRLPGSTVEAAVEVDNDALARDLGRFLVALRTAPSASGPMAGHHSYYRGCHPSVYGEQVLSDAIAS
jgi:aminoglycoside phosphotransferase (APT) family kinase protein